MSSTGKQFLKHVVPAVLKPLRVLWNELIAFIFVVLAAMMGFSTYGNFMSPDPPNRSPLVPIFGALFTVLLLYFALSSVLKARKISKKP